MNPRRLHSDTILSIRLSLRMEKHQRNAIKIAEFLVKHPFIAKVNYPGLPHFAQAAIAEKQMTGYSGLMSFKLNTEELTKVKQFVNALKLFQIGVSWGGHESLVYAPAISGLKEQSQQQFEKMGISLSDIRISVGLENSEDLINDLSLALSVASNE